MASFMFTLSARFREAADKVAAEKGISTAALMREALGAYIDYDLKREVEGRPRKTKYASPEAKKAARKERNAQKKREEKELLNALKHGLKKSELEAIKKTLKDQSGL